MKFQFPEDFVPTEEKLELPYSINEWKIIHDALLRYSLEHMSITPARMAKEIRDELAGTRLYRNKQRLEKLIKEEDHES
tara:strand:- start:111 stop:347 length:237 start_codon:yes stop_codon:yes gene_type:complete